MKFNVAQRELIFKGNKPENHKKLLYNSFGKNKDPGINERKTINYKNIHNIAKLVYKKDEANT